MSEQSAVQNPMVKYAGQIGWKTLSRSDATQMRGGESGLYLTEILREKLRELNPFLTPDLVDEVVRRLGLLHTTIEGNREALEWLRGEKSVFVAAENRERNVRLIDFDAPEANDFRVTDEWKFKAGLASGNRADVTFLINGVPVAICETKKAGKPDGIAEGVHQLRRYHKETPELVTAPQVYEVTQLLDLYYGPTWSLSRKAVFNWREEAEDAASYEAKVKSFFDRRRFLRVLKDYIVFLTKDDETVKVILRQHQTRAVEKVVDRVRDPMKRRGLVWHTQGSGKTLTMLTVAARLLREAEGEGGQGVKPTVLMLVDRNELEQQLFKNVAAYGIGTVEVAQSKRDLERLLKADYRGLLVSMIHKFDGIPADVNTRDSIVVLVDEAHRTTGGDLGNYLEGAIPNATYIGFTGTPIDQLSRGQGTFKVFGRDDPDGYTDKYSVKESVEDGTTLKLNYALAPSEMRVDDETLESEFLGLMESEGVAEIEEVDAILSRSVVLREMMKSRGRVDKIAAYVADHFRENVEPLGFKAFLVGVDREACVLYKQALDRHLPPEWSQVVISEAHNDPQHLKDHYLTGAEEKEVRKAFAKKGGDPKILIVTQKLLTGFDAPILYAMYLDKPMRDHVLLQAIARVNRPYEDDDGLVKPYGFVLDFVGLFDKLERALAFDSDTVASVVQNVEVLRGLFSKMMAETAPDYLPLTKGWDDKAKERAIEAFEDDEKRRDFFKFYRRLQNLYDVLSPDPFLRPHVEDFKALSHLFGLIRQAYSDRVYIDKELSAKTRELLQTHTDGGAMAVPGEIHELGASELAALKGDDTSDTVKVLNLRKILGVKVDEEAGAKPYLVPIGERARALAESYQDRQMTTAAALEAFAGLAGKVVEAESERESLGLSETAYAVYLTLGLHGVEATPEVARDLDALFLAHPDSEWDTQQKGRLRTALYKRLSGVVEASDLVPVTNALLSLTRS